MLPLVSTPVVDDLPGAVPAPLDQCADSILIDAPVERVWQLVTAIERYGEWSSENVGGYWRKRPDDSLGDGQVGDQFVGINRRDGREWKGMVEIVHRDENREFAFVTGGLEHNLVLWRYQLYPEGNGTRLVESWTLRNATPTMAERGEAERTYRRDNAVTSMRATLEGLKAAAES
jgi:hypothetical protein